MTGPAEAEPFLPRAPSSAKWEILYDIALRWATRASAPPYTIAVHGPLGGNARGRRPATRSVPCRPRWARASRRRALWARSILALSSTGSRSEAIDMKDAFSGAEPLTGSALLLASVKLGGDERKYWIKRLDLSSFFTLFSRPRAPSRRRCFPAARPDADRRSSAARTCRRVGPSASRSRRCRTAVPRSGRRSSLCLAS